VLLWLLLLNFEAPVHFLAPARDGKAGTHENTWEHIGDVKPTFEFPEATLALF
jgi:hypothetical protein